jgi:hypothetical protein
LLNFFVDNIVFVVDAAYILLKNVFHGDDAGRTAVFIQDHSQVKLRMANLLKECGCVWVFIGLEHIAHVLTNIKIITGYFYVNKVADMEDAYDFVDVAFVDRYPRILFVLKNIQQDISLQGRAKILAQGIELEVTAAAILNLAGGGLMTIQGTTLTYPGYASVFISMAS